MKNKVSHSAFGLQVIEQIDVKFQIVYSQTSIILVGGGADNREVAVSKHCEYCFCQFS